MWRADRASHVPERGDIRLIARHRTRPLGVYPIGV
jgi:hypothetical protein